MKKNEETIENIKAAIKNLYNDMEETFNNALEGQTDFRVYDTHCFFDGFSLKLAIFLNEEKKEICRWTLEFVLEKVDILNEDGDYKFTSNIGTCGEFSLDDKSKGSRNNFYIQVGKVLGNSNIMEIIRNGMLEYGEAIRAQREKLEKLAQ